MFEVELLILIVIVAFVVWALFVRDINPVNKTDRELIIMHKAATKRFMRNPGYSRQLEILHKEMEKRGLFKSDDYISNQDTPNSTGSNSNYSEPEKSAYIQDEGYANKNVIQDKSYGQTNNIGKSTKIQLQDAISMLVRQRNEIMWRYKKQGMSNEEAYNKACEDIGFSEKVRNLQEKMPD